MKKLIYCLFLFFIPLSIFAQEEPEYKQYKGFLVRINKDDSKNNYRGTPYMSKEFQNGQISIYDTLNVNALLRYNIYNDQIEVKDGEDVSALTKTTGINFIINSDKIVLVEGVTENGSIQKYMIELYSGANAQVYRNYKKVYIPGQEAINSYSSDTKPEFKSFDYTFIKIGEKLYEVSNSNKKTIRFFGKKYESQLQNYAKKNKLKVKRIEDLVKLVSYYDSIK